jgi:hypothetical protein
VGAKRPWRRGVAEGLGKVASVLAYYGVSGPPLTDIDLWVPVFLLLWPTHHGRRGNGTGSYPPNVLKHLLTGEQSDPPYRFISAKRWMIVVADQGSNDHESCPRALAHIVTLERAQADRSN